MLFQRTPPSPIGLHVGSDAVRLLQLRRTPDDRLAIQAVALVPMPPDDKLAGLSRFAAATGAVRDALKRGGFRGRDIVAALPRDLVHLRTLRLPPMPDADVSWAVQADARDVFLFDTAKARIEFIDAGEVRHGGEVGREIIMAAAGEAYIDQFVRHLDSAGLVVRSLDIEPSALNRAIETSGRSEATTVTAALDVGDDRSHVLISAGGRIRVLRVVDVGASHINQAVCRKLGVTAVEAERLRQRATAPPLNEPPPAESVRRALADATRGPIDSIVREMTQALRYHAVAFRGAGPSRLRLLGDETSAPQFRAALADAGVPPMETVDLFAGVDASQLVGSTAQWAIALGLATRPLGRSPANVSVGKEATHA